MPAGATGRAPTARKAAVGKLSRSEGLDPETQYAEIYKNLVEYEFPWDITQALSFALFRTYAVPSIGSLLDRTGEFTERTQKRHDDTALLLDEAGIHGLDSPKGKAAIRRINQMHRMYDISNDDMRYVLATFVVTPRRWIDSYCFRPLTEAEVTASVRYYQALGTRMGIKDIPADYAAFDEFLNDYEREHFAYDDGARRVADATMELFKSFYVWPLSLGMGMFGRAIMDEPLLDAFRYQNPAPAIRRAAAAALRLRSRFTLLLPPRRKPKYAYSRRRIRSYPGGFEIEKMGTFTPGCPVHPEPPAVQSSPARP